MEITGIIRSWYLRSMERSRWNNFYQIADKKLKRDVPAVFWMFKRNLQTREEAPIEFEAAGL